MHWLSALLRYFFVFFLLAGLLLFTSYSLAFEVVGATGRLGSQWLRQPGSRSVPRGQCPGSWTHDDEPIVVAVPSSQWASIVRQTPLHRQSDLVFVGNGLLTNGPGETATCVVPHYGILAWGARPSVATSSSPPTPPTFAYGKHATFVQTVLEQDGIQCELVQDWQVMRILAARKLLWASCLWLVCHHRYKAPLTLLKVYNDPRHERLLLTLLQELWPAYQAVAGGVVTNDWNETLAYIRSYSHSMPNAIPSKTLALTELAERNGVFATIEQPLHCQLVQDVAGPEAAERIFRLATSSPPQRLVVAAQDDSNPDVFIELEEMGLRFYGTSSSERRSPCKSVIIVGAGIMGSALAYHLASEGVAVTVLDRQVNDGKACGLTTPASWAWLNANNKSPLHYRNLNELGLHAWRRTAVLQSLPIWNGSLVQYREPLPVPARAGYEVTGPQNKIQQRKLEPLACFVERDGPVYHFPEEGCVDPVAGVKCLRAAATARGAQFVDGANVTSITHDDDSGASGVVYDRNGDDDNATEQCALHADIVVVAAGIGAASAELGSLPLRASPGMIVTCTTPPAESSSATTDPRLSRVLVDTVNEVHVLQRRNGNVVVGGGHLEKGGVSNNTAARVGAYDEKNVISC